MTKALPRRAVFPKSRLAHPYAFDLHQHSSDVTTPAAIAAAIGFSSTR